MSGRPEAHEPECRAARARQGLRRAVAAFILSACAAAAVVLGAFALLPGTSPAEVRETARAEGAPEALPGAAPVRSAPDEILVRVTTEGDIRPGQTLVGSLSSHGVSGFVAHVIATEMSPVFDFRYAQPGDAYHLVQDAEGEVVRFDYARSPLETYSLRRNGDGYVAERHQPELVRERARLAGVVTSSLYEAVASLGERPDLASDFAEIFAWDVDFTRSVHRGDEFSILYERLQVEDSDGSLLYERPGRILAARYSNADDDYAAVYFELEEGRGGYYRPDGSSVQRQFLKAPLNYRRISSGYSMSRLHPILKVRRPHQGIDYAAPEGTPIWAVGDGVVTFRGWSGGFGNLVKVRHANGFVSTYGHLSRYAQGLRVGQRVRQKQVIGYVGSTGLATGPHICFRFKRNGQYVNPESVLHQPTSGPPLPDELRPAFLALRDDLLRELDPALLPMAVEEAL
jgi:murein DD-endopeptidase MepM/ murein hydrolase activator NlpD